jgi:cell wall assembly regulator SMI1
MRNLEEININEGGRPVTRPPPAVHAVTLFENEFGLLLPEGIRRLLSFANGGHPELSAIDSTAGQYAINRFYHLSEENRGDESLWYAVKHWRPILGNKALPFANDAGGNQYFLDLSKDPAPVKICVHDQNFRVVDIAASIDDFIDGLHVDPDMI